jgi:hypothetical protein
MGSVKMTGKVCLGERNPAGWASEHGQMTKTRQSDARRGKTIPTVAPFGRDRHKIEGYLGNVD